MHLLFTKQGTISEAGGVVDLAQSPADIIFLSAADTELSCLSAAKNLLGADVPDLRLASLLALSHPMSIDMYVERTMRHARIVIVRLLGGESYWRYGLETFHALAVASGIAFAALPGDDKPDPGIARFSTIRAEDIEQLWLYLVEGGSDNAQNFLHYCSFLLGHSKYPPGPALLMKAGLWWPSLSQPMLKDLQFVAGLNERPIVGITFYRALVQSGQTAPIKALIKALQALNLAPLPVFVSSLKDSLSVAVLSYFFSIYPPDIVLNATSFSVSVLGKKRKPTVLEMHGNMVLQVIFSSASQKNWRESTRGLLARDVAMNVSLPEVDGRVLSRAISFKEVEFYDHETQCNIVHHMPLDDRVKFVAELTAAWITLKQKNPAQRRIAMIMSNYPGSDGRLGHGVGLDTPAALMVLLRTMQAVGYDVKDLPLDGNELIRFLALGPTNAGIKGRIIRENLACDDYQRFFNTLPEVIRKEMLARWGKPKKDAYVTNEMFALPVMCFGNTVVGIQPARTHGVDTKQAYHASDIVPSHHYMAFYFWLRYIYQADAIVHIGKHGNLEWLPGKSFALSDHCYPEIALGPLPHIYPFIVNDPGEGTQAKRRSSAVIIGHMTPPLTRAESYGPLKDLEVLVDEYYEAASVDPRRLAKLKMQILDLMNLIGINRDAGIKAHDDPDLALQKLDAFLCDLKELQIRDGLHIFGKAAEGEQLTNLLVALVRVPRGTDGYDSLHRAIAYDLQLGFDPLNCTMTDSWQGPKDILLADMSNDPWRSTGDTVERIEKLCTAFVSGNIACPEQMTKTKLVLKKIEQELRPLLVSCAQNEIKNLLLALDGRFVPPGPSGAPTRGRLDVLPTGRNFFSVDNRAVPTAASWDLGARSAELLITRYVQDYGEWPTSFGLTAWGTSNMRTGGDDIAQALALIGVKPIWDNYTHRVMGYEIIPLAKLGRPRVDVTLRVSGFFRDAFPEQLVLLAQAFYSIGMLDESNEDNPMAMRMRNDAKDLENDGISENEARKQASYRIFTTCPGTYGTGVPDLIDSGNWEKIDDLGEAWTSFSSYAYGAHQITEAGVMLKKRLRELQAIVQNQDNREHDLLDSGEYYAFEGGMAAAVIREKGRRLPIYHNDFSSPERPIIKTLEEEIGRTLRGRAVNPKWIESIMRHGYKAGAEMAATVDYLFAFSATTNAVVDAHFDAVYDAYLVDDKVRQFLYDKNHAALCEIASRLHEAIQRSLWTPRSNSARFALKNLIEKKNKYEWQLSNE
ncbi:MAG: cobaltochelatase CobN [Candidatus Tokpelaia sp. JSC188]|nr:MAG: cobaltochelatase CobN [Candidatus Tokpelaia sp. JSC188]